MIFRFTYNIILLFLALITLPKYLYQLLKFGKYTSSLKQRFGYGIPTIQKGEQPLIWLHAVSVGETRALKHLVKEIKQKHPNSILVISNVTETGHQEAKRSLPEVNHYIYLPLDLSWIIRPVVKKICPDLVILCETDYWYNFLSCSKEVGAKIVVVNGKLSERSLHRYRMFDKFSQKIFGLVDRFYLQNELYRERFRQLGIPKDRLVVTGNLKFDEKVQDVSVNGLREELGIEGTQPVITLGSSHAPEEKMMLDMLDFIWNKFPKMKLLLVPRHPERFDDVEKILEKHPISFIRYSRIAEKTGKENVILIDTMGMLRRCYAISNISLVGGSFFKGVGGHNILEPCYSGVPVLFGDYMYSQPDLESIVHDSGAGEQITPSDIPNVLTNLLNSKKLQEKMGTSGIELVEKLRGATRKTMDALVQTRYLESE